jgi:hypothetical protein
MIESFFFGRRKFLRLGALGAVFVAGGCGGSDDPQKVTTAPAPTGNRNRLKRLADKAEESKTNKKK